MQKLEQKFIKGHLPGKPGLAGCPLNFPSVFYVTCTQEQLLGFELLRECRMCFTQHQESVKVVYTYSCALLLCD